MLGALIIFLLGFVMSRLLTMLELTNCSRGGLNRRPMTIMGNKYYVLSGEEVAASIMSMAAPPASNNVRPFIRPVKPDDGNTE